MGKLSLAEQVRLIEDFLNENFAFRHNEVSDIFEYKVLKPEMGDMPANTDYEPVSDEALNSIILEAMKAGIEGKVTDLIKRIICSKTTESYNPFVSKEKMQKPIDRKPIYLVVEFILFNFNLIKSYHGKNETC